MNTKVYVDNLAAAITENSLMELFSSYGYVVEVNVPVDRMSGRPYRFGFVTMATPEGARSAIEALNGIALGPGALTVCEAPPGEEQVRAVSGQRSPRRSSGQLF